MVLGVQECFASDGAVRRGDSLAPWLLGCATRPCSTGTSPGCGMGLHLELLPPMCLVSPEGYLSLQEGPPVYILSTQWGHFVRCLPCRCIFLSLFCARRTVFLELSRRPGGCQSLEEARGAGLVRRTRRGLRKPRTQSGGEGAAPRLPGDSGLWPLALRNPDPPHR